MKIKRDFLVAISHSYLADCGHNDIVSNFLSRIFLLIYSMGYKCDRNIKKFKIKSEYIVGLLPISCIFIQINFDFKCYFMTKLHL